MGADDNRQNIKPALHNGEIPMEMSANKQAETGDEPKISAAERRRQRKAEMAAAKAKEKAEKKANAPQSSKKDAEETDPTKYFENRVAAATAAREAGVEVYPHKWHCTMRLQAYQTKYADLVVDEIRDEHVSISGRVMRIAGSGAKLKFLDLHSDDVKLQIICSASNFTDDFTSAIDSVHRGDIIGVAGKPGRSKTGELSLFATELRVLSPCYHMLPTLKGGHQAFSNQEVRYRQRYLDFIVNPDNKRTFKIRSQIISFLRRFFDSRDFVEVETPYMHPIHGGASARPFVTHHNDLDTQLFMRVAPELYLKMLTVGGMERVYEIGKNFRNEGIDLTHNPEFTAIEFYCAYWDYNDLLQITEKLISEMVMTIHGTHKIKYHPEGPTGPEIEIDFTPPFQRISFVAEIEKRSGEPIPRPLHSQAAIDHMAAVCKKHAVDLPHPLTPSKLLDTLCGHFLEKGLVNPTFIVDHPEIMSPLAKWHRDMPEMTERGELFVCGKELANFYTELNDPFKQRALFQQQVQDGKQGDDEAQPYDENFCVALEHGLPPTAGWGLGIDRLTMFLADKNNIKEVILFPAMRPEVRK